LYYECCFWQADAEWSGGVKNPLFLLSGPNSSPVSWASLRFSLLEYIEYFGIMYQSVVGKLSRFFAIAVSIAVASISKQRRSIMKERKSTPESEIQAQTIEVGLRRVMRFPDTPLRIFSLVNGNYLYADQITGDIKITRADSPPLISLWRVTAHRDYDYIQAAVEREEYWTAVGERRVNVDRYVQGDKEQEWIVADAGGGAVTIVMYKENRYKFVTVDPSGAEGSAVYLENAESPTRPNQKFILGF